MWAIAAFVEVLERKGLLTRQGGPGGHYRVTSADSPCAGSLSTIGGHSRTLSHVGHRRSGPPGCPGSAQCEWANGTASPLSPGQAALVDRPGRHRRYGERYRGTLRP